MYSDFALRAKRFDEAFEHASRALEIAKQEGTSATPWVSAALYYLGSTRYHQGRGAEAM